MSKQPSQAQKAMQVQASIKRNADEVSNMLGDLSKWEKKISKKVRRNCCRYMSEFIICYIIFHLNYP